MTTATIKRRRPEEKFRSRTREDTEQTKAQRKEVGGIRKEATSVKVSDGAELGGVFTPSDEQLAKINQFTKRTVSAEEVACFTAFACNDLVDRDDEQFTKDCVDEFKGLPVPLSPVGKSYMVSHDRRSLPVGRIFDVDTEDVTVDKAGNVHFLTNDVYIPRLESNADFIANQEFGVYWAVSVGVMLGADKCTVCESPFQWHGWWCKDGHEKGLFYDPKSDEEDDYGWPLPCDENAKGAVKCIRQFYNPQDYYELSQVWLGAQYFAELASKDPAFDGIVKAASASGVPIVGFSREEAKGLPILHEPEKVQEARQKYKVTRSDDGVVSWVTEEKLKYRFDPNDTEPEVVCLGMAEEATSGSTGPDPGSTGTGNQDQPQPGQHQPGKDGGGQPQGNDSGNQEAVGGPVGGPSGNEGRAAPVGAAPGKEEETVSKAAVIAAATAAKVPVGIVEQLAEADGNGLELLLTALADKNSELETQVTELTEKAEAGEQYVKDLKAETVHWYVTAKQDDRSQGVSTDTVERLLTACGDNTTLIKALRDEYQELARAKFPEAVRRTTFPDDPNHRKGPGSDDEGAEEKRPAHNASVSRIHRS